MSKNRKNNLIAPYYVIPASPSYGLPIGGYPAMTAMPNDLTKSENRKPRYKYPSEIHDRAVELKDRVTKRLEMILDEQPEVQTAEDIFDLVRINFSGEELLVIGSGLFRYKVDQNDNCMWVFNQPTTRDVMNHLKNVDTPWVIVKAQRYANYTKENGVIRSHLISHTFIERPYDEDEETEEEVDNG